MSLPCKRGIVDSIHRQNQTELPVENKTCIEKVKRETKTSSRRMNDIETLSEQLGSLQITEEVSSDYKQTDIEMSAVPALVAMNENIQAVIPKSMVLDPEWFDGDWTKFENWQRGIRLFLKSNRVLETDNRITAILAHLREGVAGIYTQRKLDELDKETRTQDQEEFVQEIKTIFSNKTKTTDAKWKIETFKQEKKKYSRLYD